MSPKKKSSTVILRYTIQKSVHFKNIYKFIYSIYTSKYEVVCDYVALIVCRIQAEFGVILSYIRGRSMPFG